MTCGTGMIGASLIAIMAERFILDPYLGRKAMCTCSGRLAQTAAAGAAVAFMLTAAPAAAWLLTTRVLLSLGAAYLYGPLLIMLIMLFGLAGEMSLSMRRPFSSLNGEFGKTIVISSMLGFLLLVPRTGDFSQGLSLARTVATGAKAGGVFFLTTMLYNATKEKTTFSRDSTGTLLYAHELARMGLVALVLNGIAHLNFFK